MDILKKMKNLKWIHYGSTGTDQEIINYSKNKKIKISNSKKLFDYSVASTALAFILCLSEESIIHYIIEAKIIMEEVFIIQFIKI